MGRWLVTAAWPYINYVPHLGTMIGSVLSADVVARYLRLKGEEVVFVSGSDEHGTPIEVEAIRRGVEPRALTDENHKKVKRLFELWGISFDNYTRTESEVHKRFVREFYMKLYKRGYIFTEVVKLPYCPKCRRFLPDRFVEGTCPYCGYEGARGDQCDKCGRLLEPLMLINPRCTICGSKPEVRESKHWFFDLPKLTEDLKEYILNNPNLPDNARNMSLRMLEEGLKPRSLTRDNKWGIPAPFPGAENKTIYVWMEAVLGYISATMEYFIRKGDPEGWKRFWLDPSTRTLYFIAKDNIPFHTLIFPALLIASGEGYNLPWRVDSVEYLLFEGMKFSKSRRIGVWIDEALELFPADYWRFVLISIRPETKDTSFTWKIFREVINSVLNDVIGNFIHRVLTFTYKNFNGKIPTPTKLTERDKAVIDEAIAISNEVAKLIESFRLKDALSRATDIARLGNRYLNEEKPWDVLKQDKERAASIMYTALRLVKMLAIVLAPFIPFSADKIWKMLGYKDSVHSHRWQEVAEDLPSGQELGRPKPLFRKVTDEELKRIMERTLPKTSPKVTAEELSKIDIRVAKVVEAERISGSNKLLKLKVDLGGNDIRQCIAGIGEHYEPRELIGKHIVVIANITPKVIKGEVSEVMLLAAISTDGKLALITTDREVKPGSRVL
ncbi:MAG: methionine--tRNA ligase [Thermoprotei archaeon]|nr:MAG: methionine--tRNA ligase [Thermoprotei archaeon]